MGAQDANGCVKVTDQFCDRAACARANTRGLAGLLKVRFQAVPARPGSEFSGHDARCQGPKVLHGFTSNRTDLEIAGSLYILLNANAR
jgi:hypothetical protein